VVPASTPSEAAHLGVFVTLVHAATSTSVR